MNRKGRIRKEKKNTVASSKLMACRRATTSFRLHVVILYIFVKRTRCLPKATRQIDEPKYLRLKKTCKSCRVHASPLNFSIRFAIFQTFQERYFEGSSGPFWNSYLAFASLSPRHSAERSIMETSYTAERGCRRWERTQVSVFAPASPFKPKMKESRLYLSTHKLFLVQGWLTIHYGVCTLAVCATGYLFIQQRALHYLHLLRSKVRNAT